MIYSVPPEHCFFPVDVNMGGESWLDKVRMSRLLSLFQCKFNQLHQDDVICDSYVCERSYDLYSHLFHSECNLATCSMH